MKKYICALLSIMLLSSAALVACSNDIHFDLADRENTSDAPDTAAGQEFTYRESEDTNLYFFRDLPSAQIEVHNGYIYYYNGRTLVRYNPITNVQTTLCEDALCSHEDGQCPFYGYDSTQRFTVFGNNIVFCRFYIYSNYNDTLTEENCFVRYDMENQQLSTLRDITGNVVSNGTDLYLGDKHLYVDILYDEENDRKLCRLCLKDLKTDEIEVLREDEGRQMFSPMYVHGDQIYYKNTVDHLLCVAPISDPGQMVPLAQAPSSPTLNIAEQSVYALDVRNGSVTYSISPEECITIPGIEGADYFYMTDNYIYYRKVYDTVSHTSFYGEPVTTSLRAYYRCSHDGQNHELIYREEPVDGDYTIFMGDFVVLGDYIYTRWSQKILLGENTEHSDQTVASTIARYDIETGEWYYIMNE